MTYRILVTGTRAPDIRRDPETCQTIWQVVREHVTTGIRTAGHVTIVHGDCPTGVDSLMNTLVLTWPNDLTIERHPADWRNDGRAAGPIRNRRMIETGADVCLAFPMGRSPGTRGCINLAQTAGIPTIITEV